MSENKQDLTPLCMRARNFVSQGRMNDALDLYADILLIDPDNALVYADRGTAYAIAKKFDLALADFERAIRLGYKDASAYCTVATIYFEQRRLDEALQLFAEAISLDPAYPVAYYNRSNVFYALGNRGAAIDDLEKCLQFSPDENMNELVLKRLNFIKTASGL